MSSSEPLHLMFSVGQRSNVGKNLASLPLVAVRICWVQSMFVHDMDESRVGHLRIWRSSARSIASDIAEALPSLRVIAIGDGVNVYNDALARHRFRGAEIWWRIVPEEPEDELEDGDSDDEEEGAEGTTESPGHDMKSTAVKLLLSVLEGTLPASRRCVHTSTRHRKRIPTCLHATHPCSTTSSRFSNHSRRRRTKKYTLSHERHGWS